MAQNRPYDYDAVAQQNESQYDDRPAHEPSLRDENRAEPFWSSNSVSDAINEDIVLRYSNIDRDLTPDDRRRAPLTHFQEVIIARITAFLTGRLDSPVELAQPRRRQEVLHAIKQMLSSCYRDKHPRYTNDPVRNRKEAVVGREVIISSIEPLGNPKLNLEDDHVFPTSGGLGISKEWPGLVTMVLPNFNGYLRQRMSSKEGKGLTAEARRSDYHSQHCIRIIPDGESAHRLPGETCAPLGMVDDKNPGRWVNKVLISTVEFVSFEQYSSWGTAHVRKEDFSQIH